jgi:hypothetical protein
MFAVQYRLATPYPAQPFLDDLSARLTSRGWKPMERDFLNPTIPTSNVRGWTAFVDGRAKPPMGIHQWLGGWTDQKGAVVSYALTYRSAANGIDAAPPADTGLTVNAFLVPPERAREMAAAAAERIRKK